MPPDTNRYCDALELEVPALEAVRTHRDANYYSLLIVALLERGAPMTLEEAAQRFVAAGVAPSAERARTSLKRCKPGRAPVQRDGVEYALDVHSDELDLWLFRLGLRPADTHPIAGSSDTVGLSYAARRLARREAKDHELAALRTAIVVGFPAPEPAFVSILDADRRQIDTFAADQFDAARSRLDDFDVVASEDVRATLRGFGIDPNQRRLAELAPPQKSKRLNRSGRTLTITNTLLVRGSCRISRPFGEPRRMARYLENGEFGKLVRRLESDAKSLLALFWYGRLQHSVRLKWGFLDTDLPAPWAHWDATSMRTLMIEACDTGRLLEVVAGSAPSWSSPWSRAKICTAQRSFHTYGHRLLDTSGEEIDARTVQLARLVPKLRAPGS